MKRIVFLILFLLFYSYCFAQEGQSAKDWEVIKEEDGITVYARKSAGDEYYIIKAITHKRTNLSALVALLKDAAHYTEWMHAAEESWLVNQHSKDEFTYYLHSNLPWPAEDRDVVVKTRIRQRNDKVIVTKSTNIEGEIEPREDITRMKYLDASWKFEPTGYGKVRIVYKGKFLTHDYIPDWLQEEIYHVAPYNTIKNMRKAVSQPKYQNANISFIRN